MSLVLIQNGEVYTPDAIGVQSILSDGEKIIKIGEIEAQKVLDLGIPCEVIDAAGCVVTPGLIDPHSHIIGAGGEEGFTSRMPELSFSQVVRAGITTVVGLLGTDTTTRHLSSLYAKAVQFYHEGITGYLYIGGFQIPPTTFTGSVSDDLVFIDRAIGTGEIAISDSRWADPKLHRLAIVVTATMLGGMMAGKAGITHFHTGPGKKRLSLLFKLLDKYEIPPACLYVTHIERSPELMDDAITLAKRGAYVDIDTVDEKLADYLCYYRQHHGPAGMLTVSSDSNTPGGSPEKFFSQFVSAVRDACIPLEEVLPHFTRNTARVLKLGSKGELAVEKDADILVLRKDSLEIAHLIARGKPYIKDGQITKQSQEEKLSEESVKEGAK